MASRVNLGPVETVTVNGMVAGPMTDVSLGSSPCTMLNACSVRIAVNISAGTVTSIELSKDDGRFDSMGLLGGQILLNPSDTIRLTYAVAPTVSFSPL